MTRTRIPVDVLSAAHARAAARAARDWAEADRLRAVIEAAGWKVADRGTDFALSPAAPPDIVEEERVRYGASRNVPARTDDAAVDRATIVLIATDRPDDIARAIQALRALALDGTSLVVVADDPSDAQAAALETIDPSAIDVVWTSARLGRAAALNIGIRRAAGPLVIGLGEGVEPAGDIVSPVLTAFDDPTVAIVGRWGRRTIDLRTFTDADSGDVDVVDGDIVAFRRVDGLDRGPLDERFRTDRWLDAWWSLVLRDEGEGRRPRRGLLLGDLPVIRHDPAEAESPESEPSPEADRSAKRDGYRLLDRFGARPDLRSGGA